MTTTNPPKIPAQPCGSLTKTAVVSLQVMKTYSAKVVVPILLTYAAAAASLPSNAVLDKVKTFLEAEFDSLGDQVNVTIAPSKLDLHSCRAPSPFIPRKAISRTGRIFVGLVCAEQGGNTLYLQARVQVNGKFLKLARAVDAGTEISRDMLRQEAGDITPLLSQGLLTSEAAVGQITRHSLSKGTVLRPAHLKIPNLVEIGQPVQVLAQGGGFSISGTGEALQSGNRGEVIKVKTANRKILSAVVADRGTVRLEL